jgi:hypothetical protein
MRLKYVLKGERSSAVDRDVEQCTRPAVLDRMDELRHVAMADIRALIGNCDVALAPLSI